MRFAALAPVLFCVAVFAQTPEKRGGVDDLIQEAMRRNPEILAAQKKLEAARQKPAQERALPDPMVSVGWNSSGNPLPFAGVGKEPVANVGVMASQELPYAGKLRLRGEVAQKEADAEAQEYRAVVLSVISRLKQAHYRLHHSYVEVEILERNRELVRSLLRAAEARYSVGKAAQQDVFKTQTQLTILEGRVMQTDRERRNAEDEIRGLLVWPASKPVDHPDEMMAHDLGFTLEGLVVQARETAPALKKDQKMIERAGSALNLARREFYPDVTLNGGYYYMGSMPPMYMFRADVKLPFQTGRRKAAVAEQSYALSQARHAYEFSDRSLEYRIRDLYRAAETAARLMKLYSETAMPQAKLTVESSLAGYQNGTSDLMTVLNNHVAALEYEMNYHGQMVEFHIALAKLEEITGVRVTQ